MVVIVIKVHQSFAFSPANGTLPEKDKIARSPLGTTPVYLTRLTPCYLTLIPKKKKWHFSLFTYYFQFGLPLQGT